MSGMNVEVVTGLPGCGKSHHMRQEATQNPGLYLFAYPSKRLIEEQLNAFSAETEIPVVEAHSDAPGNGTVQNRLERHQAYFEANSIDHAVVLMTHEGLMGADLSAFGDWNVWIDEAPNTIQKCDGPPDKFCEQRFERDAPFSALNGRLVVFSPHFGDPAQYPSKHFGLHHHVRSCFPC